jgi:hypothetical protein
MLSLYSFDNDDDDMYGGKVAVKYLNKLLKQSYKSKTKTDTNIDNKYYLDNDLSTDKTKVYINKDTNEISMVNRGTSDIKDVMTDVKMFFGYNDERFDEPRLILDKIKSKYPTSTIDILGHSLGAKVAEEIGRDPVVKNIITLNKPTTPKDLLYKSKITDKQYDIRTSKDLVSVLAPLQIDPNDLVIPSETYNLYTEHKIDTLDRLPQDLIIGSGKKRLKKADIKTVILRHLRKNKDISKEDRQLLKNYLKD